MPNDMTPERAVEIVAKLQGEDGIVALEDELKKTIENRRTQITLLQGEMNGYKTVIRLLGALRKRWGLGAGDPDGTPSSVEAKQPEGPSAEVKERLLKGLCSYKAFRGKWCVRKLRTKTEKASGYCKTHMNELRTADAT